MTEDGKHKTLEQLRQTRIDKIVELRKKGINPYPYKFEVTKSIDELITYFDSMSESKENFNVAGRLLSNRIMGNVSFADIRDESYKIQIHIRKDEIGEEGYDLFKLLDIGDFIGVKGYFFTTKTGEKTIWVNELTLLSKAIRPLPIPKIEEVEITFKVSFEDGIYSYDLIDYKSNNEYEFKIMPQKHYLNVEVKKEGEVIHNAYPKFSIDDYQSEIKKDGYVNKGAIILIPHYGLKNMELRYRQRYADLAVRSDVRETFLKRTKIVSSMRKFLDDNSCIEVDTPVLQPMYGGAMAEPFVTHHKALDRELYLRIADELYLKRLLVGGFERVYEFSKDFRNEGMDRLHNPEFTMLELYIAYWDYNDMLKFVEEMISHIALELNGTTEITYRGVSIDLKSPWKILSYYDALKEYGGIDLYDASKEEIIKAIEKNDVDVDRKLPEGKLLDKYFGAVVESHLDGPIFIKDYPLLLSPLAKKHRDDPNLVERFEPFLFGMEIGNAFTELNDPIDQRERFEMQSVARAAGDVEAQQLDEDYIRAMEYGMPPNAGLGIGIERLVMILTDSPSIKDVILFPLLKSED